MTADVSKDSPVFSVRSPATLNPLETTFPSVANGITSSGGYAREVPALWGPAEAFVADKLFCDATGEAKRTTIERYARSSAVKDVRRRNACEKIVIIYQNHSGLVKLLAINVKLTRLPPSEYNIILK
jgi:hypothetical protein